MNYGTEFASDFLASVLPVKTTKGNDGVEYFEDVIASNIDDNKGRELMKKTLAILAISSLGFISTAQASSCGDALCVPGDFSSPSGADFTMDLQAGSVHVANLGGFALDSLQPINFHASPFTNGNGLSAGTSTLSYSAINNYLIGSAYIFGATANIYISGTGTGSLIDIDGTKGDWSLSVPIFATWNDQTLDFGVVSLTTTQTFTYQNDSYIDVDGEVALDGKIHTISGQSMNYATGNAFLVGQGVVINRTSPFNGIGIILGIYGNDPLVASVPEPAPVWSMLFGLGLLGFATRRRRFA